MNLPDRGEAEFIDAVAPFLQDSDEVAVAVLGESLSIKYCNRCFRILFTDESSCENRVFTHMLSEEDRVLFPLEDGEEISAYISLDKSHSQRSALRCKISRKGSSYILVGFVTSTNDVDVFKKMTLLANEMTNLSRDLKRKNRELREAQSKIQTLSGIIPICMHCKEIRDDEGYWNNLETFISEHSQAEFSHSICSKCQARYYPDEQES